MIKPFNIYLLSRQEDYNSFNKFRQLLSKYNDGKLIQQHEFESLKLFVNELYPLTKLILFEGFYFSYNIAQIGKEFDLLKYNDKYCLNIELKSAQVSEDKIIKQLQRNEYYLLSLDIELFLISINTEDMKCHILKGNKLEIISIMQVVEILELVGEKFYSDLDTKLQPNKFLISPLNTPDKFLNNSYFLTNNQEEIKTKILNTIQEKGNFPIFINIRGLAGTGKTLLLYDLVKYLNKNILVIHCGILSEGHKTLNNNLNAKILAIKEINNYFNFDEFDFIFIDETQRIYISQLIYILNQVEIKNKVIVMSADENQVLSVTESNNNVVEKIESLKQIKIYKLSDKIRTNINMNNFISKLYNLNLCHKVFNDNIEILYANNIEEGIKIIELYQNMNFTFIGYTRSSYRLSTLNRYSYDYNTHWVIGQEFDNVIMVMDHHFEYTTHKMLHAKTHPNPDYLFRKLLLQGLTRVRENLVIVIIDNNELFKNIISIFET